MLRELNISQAQISKQDIETLIKKESLRKNDKALSFEGFQDFIFQVSINLNKNNLQNMELG